MIMNALRLEVRRKRGRCELLEGKVVGLVFYSCDSALCMNRRRVQTTTEMPQAFSRWTVAKPTHLTSLRVVCTCCSFEAAAKRLGAEVIKITTAPLCRNIARRHEEHFGQEAHTTSQITTNLTNTFHKRKVGPTTTLSNTFHKRNFRSTKKLSITFHKPNVCTRAKR